MDSEELGKLFDMAIGREVEAHDFYKEVSEKVSDPKVQDIFLTLARDEKGHEELLWKYKGDPKAPIKFSPPKDWAVAETVELPPVSADMKPADALALAMKKEQQAADLYQSLADWATDDGLKAIYQNLSNMEKGHKHTLEGLYVDVGYPEVW